ncbi:MAG: hypothetical protein Q9208_007562 [Pyrenodesmia sp. 3 TL-2023]
MNSTNNVKSDKETETQKSQPNGNLYTSKAPEDDESHQMISSLFLGPHAENYEYFKSNINAILEYTRDARLNYFPEDGRFISEQVQASSTFKHHTDKIGNAVKKAAELLSKHSVPWWSPRYAAHMCMDMSMPSLLGYFMTMLYNPNNVSIEASPLTMVAEIEAGQQLCEMFGYNLNPEVKDVPVGWGHITCGGTVANLESIWAGELLQATRNLKFYPLALRNAVKDFGPLSFIADTFIIETCVGTKKLFKDLSKWELLNLKVLTVLEIPDRLSIEYGISSAFLQNVMKKYGIQSVGLGSLERQYEIEKPIQYMVASTRHYSWPKGGAIAGIGSNNVVGIAPDMEARLDLQDLEKHLQASVETQQAVYAVVAICGSTEEGAVDSLRGVLRLREKYQAQGLSFVVHADAAWGGYFASMIPKDFKPGDPKNAEPPAQTGKGDGFVPDATLRVETQEDIFALRYADSITVDPHKAGYIPYPAGGLCYRDERMRFLITWTSPYISRAGTTESIGIYGVEGSKPGASAMSTWLANRCVGMDTKGYGALLGEVCFTISRLSAHWAAMSTESSSYVCIPLNLLPAERKAMQDPNTTPESYEKAVNEEKQKIRDRILNKSNQQIIDEDADRSPDDKAMVLLRALGSDLNINAFALNFRHSDGTLNDDVEEANYLNRRVVEALSVDSPEDDPTKIPFYLTSTEFEHELYGNCAQHFKKRLGLAQDELSLMVLRNVLMTPFPTEGNFIDKMVNIFQEVIEKEVQVCRKRNETKKNHHSFIIQDNPSTSQVHLINRSMFHLAARRRQLIASATLDPDSLSTYRSAKESSSPSTTFFLSTQNPEDISTTILNDGAFPAVITTSAGKTIATDVSVTAFTALKDRPLNSKYRDHAYPTGHMPFYLYGTPENVHIDHMLLLSPNIQLSAANVALTTTPPVPASLLRQGCILYLDDVQEQAMQPFLPTSALVSGQGPTSKGNFFFQPGKRFKVSVFRDRFAVGEGGPGLADCGYGERVATGEVVLGSEVWVDSESINRDPFKRPSQVARWREEFAKIGRELE